MTKERIDAAALALIMAALGGVLLYWGQGLRLGTARHMGPGFVPVLIAAMALGLGALLLVRAFWPQRRRAPAARRKPEPTNWTALVCISLGMLAFALLIRPAGLIPASAAAVLLASIAQRYTGVSERLLLAGGLSAAAALVFVEGLSLPFRLLPVL